MVVSAAALIFIKAAAFLLLKIRIPRTNSVECNGVLCRR